MNRLGQLQALIIDEIVTAQLRKLLPWMPFVEGWCSRYTHEYDAPVMIEAYTRQRIRGRRVRLHRLVAEVPWSILYAIESSEGLYLNRHVFEAAANDLAAQYGRLLQEGQGQFDPRLAQVLSEGLAATTAAKVSP